MTAASKPSKSAAQKAAKKTTKPAVAVIRTAAKTIPALEWSPTLCDGRSVSYADAEAACKALGKDWRLPTRPELESILDLTKHDPCVDKERFPDMQSGYYWSSTPYAWASIIVWLVRFSDGGVNFDGRAYDSGYVRAVRAASPRQ